MICLVVGMVLQGTVFSSTIQVTETGYITDYELHKDYMSITFNNSNSYDVHLPYESIDFTNHSILVVNLVKNGWMFVFPPDEYYDVQSVYKFNE